MLEVPKKEKKGLSSTHVNEPNDVTVTTTKKATFRNTCSQLWENIWPNQVYFSHCFLIRMLKFISYVL